jgi:hypothetical protein
MKYRENQPEWIRQTPHGRFSRRYLGTRKPDRLGPHLGKGSSLYRRPDQQLYEDICERMTQHGQLDASQIEVEVNDGEVTLTGSVADRRSKRLAEDITDSVHGVMDIHNQLQFQRRQTSNRWVDRVGQSGVYPASEAEEAPADAEAQGMDSWGQRERGAEGYHDHGESELRLGRQDKA